MKLFYDELKEYSPSIRPISNGVEHLMLVQLKFPDEIVYTTGAIQTLTSSGVNVSRDQRNPLQYNLLYPTIDDLKRDVKALKDLDTEGRIQWMQQTQ